MSRSAMFLRRAVFQVAERKKKKKDSADVIGRRDVLVFLRLFKVSSHELDINIDITKHLLKATFPRDQRIPPAQSLSQHPSFASNSVLLICISISHIFHHY